MTSCLNQTGSVPTVFSFEETGSSGVRATTWLGGAGFTGGRSASASSRSKVLFKSVVARRNSAKLLPKARPSSGSFLGPNKSRARTKIAMSSGAPREPNTMTPVRSLPIAYRTPNFRRNMRNQSSYASWVPGASQRHGPVLGPGHVGSSKNVFSHRVSFTSPGCHPILYPYSMEQMN